MMTISNRLLSELDAAGISSGDIYELASHMMPTPDDDPDLLASGQGKPRTRPRPINPVPAPAPPPQAPPPPGDHTDAAITAAAERIAMAAVSTMEQQFDIPDHVSRDVEALQALYPEVMCVAELELRRIAQAAYRHGAEGTFPVPDLHPNDAACRPASQSYTPAPATIAALYGHQSVPTPSYHGHITAGGGPVVWHNHYSHPSTSLHHGHPDETKPESITNPYSTDACAAESFPHPQEQPEQQNMAGPDDMTPGQRIRYWQDRAETSDPGSDEQVYAQQQELAATRLFLLRRQQQNQPPPPKQNQQRPAYPSGAICPDCGSDWMSCPCDSQPYPAPEPEPPVSAGICPTCDVDNGIPHHDGCDYSEPEPPAVPDSDPLQPYPSGLLCPECLADWLECDHDSVPWPAPGYLIQSVQPQPEQQQMSDHYQWRVTDGRWGLSSDAQPPRDDGYPAPAFICGAPDLRAVVIPQVPALATPTVSSGCAATTKSGKPCKFPVTPPYIYCRVHRAHPPGGAHPQQPGSPPFCYGCGFQHTDDYNCATFYPPHPRMPRELWVSINSGGR